MQPQELAAKIRTGRAPVVIDVRSLPEYRRGHIRGALHLPFWNILLRRRALPPRKDTLLIVTCEHGPRALLAKSQLVLAGYRNVDLLEGHMSGWKRYDLPLER